MLQLRQAVLRGAMQMQQVKRMVFWQVPVFPWRLGMCGSFIFRGRRSPASGQLALLPPAHPAAYPARRGF